LAAAIMGGRRLCVAQKYQRFQNFVASASEVWLYPLYRPRRRQADRLGQEGFQRRVDAEDAHRADEVDGRDPTTSPSWSSLMPPPVADDEEHCH
jgi:hypothetical protein